MSDGRHSYRLPSPKQGQPLTPGEVKVALVMCEGLTQKEAGSKLFLSQSTIEKHVESVYKKTGVYNGVGLLRYCMKAGLYEFRDGDFKPTQPHRKFYSIISPA